MVFIVELIILIVSGTASLPIDLGHDRVAHSFKFLQLLLKLLLVGTVGVLVEPVDGIVDGLLDGLLILIVDLAAELLVVVDLVLHVVGVSLKGITSVNLALHGSVFLG